MPHIVPDRRRFYSAREKSQDTNTYKSHHRLHQHRKQSTRQNVEGSGFKHHLTHQALRKDTRKLMRMLTLFPTLCLQKSPPGPEWCQPLPLWACLWPCSLCGGKTRRFFLKNRRNHTSISLSYKTISPENALNVREIWISLLKSLKLRWTYNGEYMKTIFIFKFYTPYFETWSLINTSKFISNPIWVIAPRSMK